MKVHVVQKEVLDILKTQGTGKHACNTESTILNASGKCNKIHFRKML